MFFEVQTLRHNFLERERERERERESTRRRGTEKRDGKRERQ